MSSAIDCIQEFSSVSGLKMNHNKSILFPLKNSTLTEVNGIPVKEKFTYLGMIIEKNQSLRKISNFDHVADERLVIKRKDVAVKS